MREVCLQIHPRAGHIMNENFDNARCEAKQSAFRIISSSLYRQQVGLFVNKVRIESN